MRSIDVSFRGIGDQRAVVWKVATTNEAELEKKLLRPKPLTTSIPVPNSAAGTPRIFRLSGPPPYLALTSAAVRLAFGDTPIFELPDTAALKSPTLGNVDAGVLIACDPEPALVTQLRSECDTSGLPRWALTILRTDQSDTPEPDVISKSEWSDSLITRVLQNAWQQLDLRRSHERLRGDLATFGSRIAHDLRTPLGGVLTTTEMLREVLAEDAPADVPLTQPILDSTEGLVKLIERASFFARASASMEPSQRVNMGTPFWNAYQQLESTLIEAQSTFTYPSDWPTVQGHESWLEAIWRSLLTNAIQHGKPGTRIEAGWSDDPAGQRFFMRNEGVVPADKRARLFFPFHRLHEPGSPRGLGLPMVRQLVEREGGRCEFADLTDGRVEFSFVLPARLESTQVLRPAGDRE